MSNKLPRLSAKLMQTSFFDSPVPVQQAMGARGRNGALMDPIFPPFHHCTPNPLRRSSWGPGTPRAQHS